MVILLNLDVKKFKIVIERKTFMWVFQRSWNETSVWWEEDSERTGDIKTRFHLQIDSTDKWNSSFRKVEKENGHSGSTYDLK